MTWRLNGVPARAISIYDRALSYGDGVFRTIKVVKGRLVFWAEHFSKLEYDASRLGLCCPVEDEWLRDCHALIEAHGDGVLKLVLSRGESARGYRIAEDASPTRLVVWSPLPIYPAENSVHGISLHVCKLRLSSQPLLAGVKHLNRLENVLARAEWSDPRYAEGVLLDQAGHVVEGVMSNLFWRKGSEWETPRLSNCGVSGVMRDWVIKHLASQGCAVNEVEVNLEQLLCVDELLVCNSLIGLWPVASLRERRWSDFAKTLQLQQFLHEDEENSR